MFAFSPNTAIYIVHQPVDFRLGIQGLAALCRGVLFKDPLSGALFVFRNRSRTALKLLIFDTQGLWCLHKRLQSGKFRVWPKDSDALSAMKAHELMVLLFNGNPYLARFEPADRSVAS